MTQLKDLKIGDTFTFNHMKWVKVTPFKTSVPTTLKQILVTAKAKDYPFNYAHIPTHKKVKR